MRRILLVLAALAVSAGTALAAAPSLTVTPHSVKAGGHVVLAGGVGACDPANDTAELSSPAFSGATRRSVKHTPTVVGHLNEAGRFRVGLHLSPKLRRGTYRIRGYCRGREFAHTTLKVS